jgi:hypothetical protein
MTALLMLARFQMVLAGIVADLISASRSILEDVSYRLRRLEDQEGRAKEQSKDGTHHE